MSIKYEEFLNALEDLCRKHKVKISTYEYVYISDMIDNDNSIDMEDFVDDTNYEKSTK